MCMHADRHTYNVQGTMHIERFGCKFEILHKFEVNQQKVHVYRTVRQNLHAHVHNIMAPFLLLARSTSVHSMLIHVYTCTYG